MMDGFVDIAADDKMITCLLPLNEFCGKILFEGLSWRSVIVFGLEICLVLSRDRNNSVGVFAGLVYANNS